MTAGEQLEKEYPAQHRLQQLEDAWRQCPPGSHEQRALALLRAAAAQNRHYIELQQRAHADRRLLEKCRHVLNGVASQIVSHDRVYRPLVDEIDNRFGAGRGRWSGCGPGGGRAGRSGAHERPVTPLAETGGRRRCRYCGRPIRFALLPDGRQVPYDPEPNPAGSLVFERARTESGDELALRRAVFAALGERPGEARYLPHRSSCPARAARRRRRGGRHSPGRRQRHLFGGTP